MVIWESTWAPSHAAQTAASASLTSLNFHTSSTVGAFNFLEEKIPTLSTVGGPNDFESFAAMRSIVVDRPMRPPVSLHQRDHRAVNVEGFSERRANNQRKLSFLFDLVPRERLSRFNVHFTPLLPHLLRRLQNDSSICCPRLSWHHSPTPYRQDRVAGHRRRLQESLTCPRGRRLSQRHNARVLNVIVPMRTESADFVKSRNVARRVSRVAKKESSSSSSSSYSRSSVQSRPFQIQRVPLLSLCHHQLASALNNLNQRPFALPLTP